MRKKLWSAMKTRESLSWKKLESIDEILDIKTLKNLAREEISIRCAIIIYVGGNKEKDSEETFSDIIKTMKSAESGETLPIHISIVNNSDIGPGRFVSEIRKRCKKENIQSEWNMHYILEEQKQGLSEKSLYEKSMDISFKSLNSDYCAIFFPGDIVQQNYLSEIDKYINDSLGRFLVLLSVDPYSVGGSIIQKIAYKQFAGNKGGSFLEKIKQISEEQECQHLIQPITKIVSPQ
jgi:hypothetical protein